MAYSQQPPPPAPEANVRTSHPIDASTRLHPRPTNAVSVHDRQMPPLSTRSQCRLSPRPTNAASVHARQIPPPQSTPDKCRLCPRAVNAASVHARQMPPLSTPNRCLFGSFDRRIAQPPATPLPLWLRTITMMLRRIPLGLNHRIRLLGGGCIHDRRAGRPRQHAIIGGGRSSLLLPFLLLPDPLPPPPR